MLFQRTRPRLVHDSKIVVYTTIVNASFVVFPLALASELLKPFLLASSTVPQFPRGSIAGLSPLPQSQCRATTEIHYAPPARAARIPCASASALSRPCLRTQTFPPTNPHPPAPGWPS